MKQKIVLSFVLGISLLFIGTTSPIFAMDDFDMLNTMNMDMMLEQSYYSMDNAGDITDIAIYNNDLNHSLDSFMFFPDLFNIMDNANINQGETADTLLKESIVAVSDGMWMPEFNDFFNKETAEIPLDIETLTTGSNTLEVPTFYEESGFDTINGLNNLPDMESEISSPLESSNLDILTGPDSIIILDTSINHDLAGNSPETALLTTTSPEVNTDMLDLSGGEIDTMLQNEQMIQQMGNEMIDNAFNKVNEQNPVNIGENGPASPIEEGLIGEDYNRSNNYPTTPNTSSDSDSLDDGD